jgi:hypothetical protein
VGWSRGWYAEYTENNYDKMMSDYGSAMRADIMRIVLGAIEMSKLVKIVNMMSVTKDIVTLPSLA